MAYSLSSKSLIKVERVEHKRTYGIARIDVPCGTACAAIAISRFHKFIY